MDSKNITSLAKNLSLEFKSNVCSLTPVIKPRYNHFLDLEFSFFLLACKVEAKHKEPKTLQKVISGKKLYTI